jgi:hypothetical protein
MPLGTYTDTMVWTKRLDDDPAHQWLRGRLHQLAEELITPT